MKLLHSKNELLKDAAVEEQALDVLVLNHVVHQHLGLKLGVFRLAVFEQKRNQFHHFDVGPRGFRVFFINCVYGLILAFLLILRFKVKISCFYI